MNSGHRRQLVYVTRSADRALQRLLARHGWSVATCDTARQAERLVNTTGARVGIFDVSSGFDEAIAQFEPVLLRPDMMWVATPTAAQLAAAHVRRCVRSHCFDFVAMPGPAQLVVDVVARAYQMAELDAGDDAPRAQGEMIGACEAMQQLFRVIGKVANTDAPVLIFGESGTGKELTAKSIHDQSIRATGPFVAINCGAIPPHLLQSELFGYERGAFTGANQRKIGYVEAANGGTLFLDEIGDLPLESQAGLLRFLQERTIQRLGGHDAILVDVRIISATHVDLEAAVSAGRFRSDLYHRLCVLRLEEPPLRARGRDIELLAQRMFERYRGDSPRHIRGFSAAALNAMYRYSWPGNVRELINRVRRAIVMAEGRVITPEDLELEDVLEQQAPTLALARENAERRAIEGALARHRNRLAGAAQELGVSRATLYRLMLSHGMRTRQGQDDTRPKPSRAVSLTRATGRGLAADARARLARAAPDDAPHSAHPPARTSGDTACADDAVVRDFDPHRSCSSTTARADATSLHAHRRNPWLPGSPHAGADTLPDPDEHSWHCVFDLAGSGRRTMLDETLNDIVKDLRLLQRN
jgi:DNA-binding NtrC family response regulator